jgi:RNA polymerase sigma-70 factor, ECF subfamily
MSNDHDFDDFVAARSPSLLRTAFLLTGDYSAAEDLVQTCLLRVYRAWSRVQAADNADDYVRQVLCNVFATSRRRRWHREQPTATLPESPAADPFSEVDLRLTVLSALATLTPRQRTMLVLRYFEDRTEPQIAALLDSVGTVKSTTSRAIETLKSHRSLATLIEEGTTQ